MKGKVNLKTIIIFAILILVIVLLVIGIGAAKTFISGATAGYEPQGLKATPNENGKTATVTWTTDKAVKASVFYGTNRASLLLMAEDSQPTDSHNILLSNLKNDTIYYYKIVVDTDNIFDNAGKLYDFKTSNGSVLTPTVAIKPSLTATKSAVMTVTPTAIPSKAASATATLKCDKTVDYNKDKIVNSLDYISCMQGKITTVTPAVTGKCDNPGDYNKDGVVNTLDKIKCLQANKK